MNIYFEKEILEIQVKIKQSEINIEEFSLERLSESDDESIKEIEQKIRDAKVLIFGLKNSLNRIEFLFNQYKKIHH